MDANQTLGQENITHMIFQQSGQLVQLLDFMTIGNTSIAKINNCNPTVLDSLTNTTVTVDGQLDLYVEIASLNSTSNQFNTTLVNSINPQNPSETIQNTSLESNNNITNPSNNASTVNLINDTSIPLKSNIKSNITWDQDLPVNLQQISNDTIKNIIKNMSDQKINSTITKETLFNVTFYQFTSIDITRTLLNLTNTTLLVDNNTSISQSSNKTGLQQQPTTEPLDIVIVDTGVSLTHPDLSIYRSLSFVGGNITIDSKKTEDRNGHGSYIAGIINAKDNGFGIIGIAPGDNIRIWSLKVCSDGGICAISDQIKAIEYITENADIFDIVNYSIENPYSKLFEKAISESVKSGIPYIVAAGNFAKNATLTTSPASNPDVITVSAIGIVTENVVDWVQY